MSLGALTVDAYAARVNSEQSFNSLHPSESARRQKPFRANTGAPRRQDRVPQDPRTPVLDASGFIGIRDEVITRLFLERQLGCVAIAQLTWRNAWRLRKSAVLRHSLRALSDIERRLGFGAPDNCVVRFRGGASDPVVRATAVLRVIRSHARPADARP